MPPKRFELRVIRQGREVRDAVYVAVLDLDDVEGTRDLLERHILAAAERAGERHQAYLFTLDVRATDREGRGHGEPIFRVALPVAPEVS